MIAAPWLLSTAAVAAALALAYLVARINLRIDRLDDELTRFAEFEGLAFGH